MAENQLPNIKFGDLSPRRILIFAGILLGVFGLASVFYTVDANENGVVTRFGKYQTTTFPGLHFKIPFGIEKVYNIKVDQNYKEEFGFRTTSSGVKSTYSSDSYAGESWMLTGDLNIANVTWVVQYKIKDPVAYQFNVRDVTNTIRDVSEAGMRLMI